MWLPLFSKISFERACDKPYFGNFDQSFDQMKTAPSPRQVVDQFVEGRGKIFDEETFDMKSILYGTMGEDRANMESYLGMIDGPKTFM